MADLEYFDDGSDLLAEGLPSWWKHEDPSSEIHKWVEVYGGLVDDLAVAIEGIHADQSLETARDEALRSEWAPLYGVSREDLPLDTETLREYLKARAAEDGSIGGLEEALLSLLEGNDLGTELVFPLDGSGLTFPSDGSGLVMFGIPPERRAYLRFPADGTGLTFPAEGGGIAFPVSARLEITEAYADYRLDVTVRDYLIFDRPAFARAVARFRQAHMVSTTITETPT